jgi:Dolichyl-phosphate-mannose-protein mannosyltransferase
MHDKVTTRAAWTWWSALALMVVFLLLNGPKRSPFSGVPLSSKATVVFLALCGVAIFGAMFPPRRRAHAGWSLALLALIVAKLVLAPQIVPTGWKGEYRNAWGTGPKTFGPLTVAWFHEQGPVARMYRVDRALDYDGDLFGLDFLNDLPLVVGDYSRVSRSVHQPLLVHWTGHLYADQGRPVSFTISSSGRVLVDIDGKRVFDASRPNNAALQAAVGAGPHVVSIIYGKPPDVVPRMHVATSEAITAFPADPRQQRRSVLASHAIDLLGALALLLLAGASWQAYRPLPQFVADDLLPQWDKAVALAVAAYFVLQALSVCIPSRHVTLEERLGDDPLVYERDARWISRNGLMLVDDSGRGSAYFFYPLYSYALGGVHILFGDDFMNIVLFNYLCMAAGALLLWALLRRYLGRPSLAILLVLFWIPFARDDIGPYAQTAFTDNLFVPAVLLVLVVSAVAFERRSIGWLFVTGLLTALAAAVRASLLTHLAFVMLAVLLYREMGPVLRRMRGALTFAAGFFIGLAPFTIRNWMVAHKFVLLVDSIVEMPWFLTLPGHPRYLEVNGHMPSFGESLVLLVKVIASAPLAVVELEMKKVLFTLGFMRFTPTPVAPSLLFIFTFTFAAALLLRRVPKPVAAALLAFCGSHLLAVMMASPWTYGYKTILPFTAAMIAGSAFLLPGRQRLFARAAEPLPADASRAVVVAGPGASAMPELQRAFGDDVTAVDAPAYAAAVRRALDAAPADVLVVVPAGATATAADVNRLLAYASDYDVVFGSRASLSAVDQALRLLGRYVAALLGSATPLLDAGCPMWLIRRSAAAQVRAELGDGDAVVLGCYFAAIRARLRVCHIPLASAGATADAPSSALRVLLRVARRAGPAGAPAAPAGTLAPAVAGVDSHIALAD